MILADTCSTGTTVPAGGTCTLQVLFVPLTAGPHPTQILLDSNAASSPDSIPVTGTGTGGVAAVGPTNPDNGFPQWYRDENGISIQAVPGPERRQLHPGAGRVLRPDAAGGLPDQLPERVLLPARDVGQRHDARLQRRSAPGRALLRTGVEGAFVNAGPAPGEQMTFGRIRMTVTGGLCPEQDYRLRHPVRHDHLTANANGGIARNRGTEDVGCTPVAPDTCDFTVALSSRVLGQLPALGPGGGPAGTGRLHR